MIEVPFRKYIEVRSWDEHPEFHNYDREIKRLGLAGKLGLAGSFKFNVAHDDGCGMEKGGRCDCKPFIIDPKTGKKLN